jgi:hypothetical protein
MSRSSDAGAAAGLMIFGTLIAAALGVVAAFLRAFKIVRRG